LSFVHETGVITQQILFLSFFGGKTVLRVKSDGRSGFSNLGNWKEEAWRDQGFGGVRARGLRDTGAMFY